MRLSVPIYAQGDTCVAKATSSMEQPLPPISLDRGLGMRARIGPAYILLAYNPPSPIQFISAKDRLTVRPWSRMRAWWWLWRRQGEGGCSDSLLRFSPMTTPPRCRWVSGPPVVDQAGWALDKGAGCLVLHDQSLYAFCFPPSMRHSYGFLQYCCSCFFSHNCVEWIYVNKSRCAGCLVCI